MSQVVLGLRSLAIKLAIFVVMAALLAWALGGTLFPKPYVANFEDDGVTIDGTTYFWRMSLQDGEDAQPNWKFLAKTGKEAQPIEDEVWAETAGPILADTGIYFGGRDAKDSWSIIQLRGNAVASRHPMPDRLAVEQQLQRLANGLPLQDASTIAAERLLVLDPPAPFADGEERPAPGGSD
jgi:hypothetical protein